MRKIAVKSKITNKKYPFDFRNGNNKNRCPHCKEWLEPSRVVGVDNLRNRYCEKCHELSLHDMRTGYCITCLVLEKHAKEIKKCLDAEITEDK